MHAEIELGRAGGRVILDGTDVSGAVRRLTVRAEAGCLPDIELDLSIVDATRIDSDHAQMLIPPATRDALVTLGWTPPLEA
ncbi:hypothetical protein [Salinispora pacifica]|uniref:hypothetical protein n=1 Tax=Salinispora pacifica TaxID=351187 RepID=UPI0004800351|nr:hypothetical protein [Salinispora pacifica]